MTAELSKGLKKLVALCAEQGKLVDQTLDIHERMKLIDENQAALAPKLDETMELYKKAFLVATDEIACITDILDKAKLAIRRRGSIQFESSRTLLGAKRLSPVATNDAKRARKASAPRHPLDIWHHSHIVLPNGTEVSTKRIMYD